MMRRTLPEPGEVLGGKYQIVRRLGEGGMGVVYEAIHARIEQRVAIKMLLPDVLELPDVVPRFEREARAAGKLRSENTVRVLDVDMSDGGIPYMVMELLDGTDLGKLLDEQKQLPIADAVDYVLQACNAMAEAHAAGIVHRDLKPANLFVTTGRKVKVLDFGISKLENDKEARVTATQTVVGTPLYMSPEQVRSAKHVDARTDIWSLGIILYELLSGRTPFEGSTTAAAAAICIDAPPPMAQLRADVPAALEQAILVALQKEPEKRFRTVTELASAISRFGSGGVKGPDTLPAPILVQSNPSLPSLPASSGEVPAVGDQAKTMPGWTTRSRQGKRRTKTVVIASFGVMAAVAVFVLGGVVARHRASVDTTAESAATPTPTETTATTAAADTITTTPALAAPSASVSTTAAVPSADVERTQPMQGHHTGHVPRPHATTAPTTHTVTAPAPAPTRL